MKSNAQHDAGQRALACAIELGFARAGITQAQPTKHRESLRSWLQLGKHGEMGYLQEHFDLRCDPSLLIDGARSIIMVADQYAARGGRAASRAHTTGHEPSGLADGRGRIARYARGRDYHKVIKKRLHELADRLRADLPDGASHEFRAFTDTAPVLEREHAMRAGLGWVGKHTLIIDPRLGSYFLLGGIVTTALLEAPETQEPVTDHCGTCTRCIDACPTDAITPYSVDGSRCISYLTIEHRSTIGEEFFEPTGDWLFGCDICQEVCPHNSPSDVEPPRVHEAYAPVRDSFDLLEVLGWTDDDRREAFTSSAMKRARLNMMKRNALIVAGNVLRDSAGEHGRLRARIEAIASDVNEDELVRETAKVVLARESTL